MQGIRYASEAPTTSFGRAAREYMRQLAARGIPLTGTPMVPGRGWGRSLEPFLGRGWPDETFGPLMNQTLQPCAVGTDAPPQSHGAGLLEGKNLT
jgi:hypothetical protein